MCALCFVRQAGKSIGMSEDQVKHFLAQMKTPKVKDRLKEYTQEALDQGVGLNTLYIMEISACIVVVILLIHYDACDHLSICITLLKHYDFGCST